MNVELKTDIERMFALDEEARTVLWNAMKEHGPRSDACAEAQAKAKTVFEANAAKLAAILDAQGWPGPEAIGEEASESAFLLLQHAGVSIQKKYLPMLRTAVESGDLKASLLAMMEDRVLLSDGEEQIYGTQFHHGEDGKPALWPIRDVGDVDERRAEVGLPPLEDYLRKAGMEHLDPRPDPA